MALRILPINLLIFVPYGESATLQGSLNPPQAKLSLKALMQFSNHSCKKKKRGAPVPPGDRVAKANYVTNFLRLTGDRTEPPIVVHGNALSSGCIKMTGARVMYKELSSGLWKGPVEVIMTGRGYVCVSTDAGPVWVPSRWVKLYRSASGSR